MNVSDDEFNALVAKATIGTPSLYLFSFGKKVQTGEPFMFDQEMWEEFIGITIADALVSLAMQMDENDLAGTGIRYEVRNHDGQYLAPDMIIDPLSGWLMGSEDGNIVAGKTRAPFPFDLYGGDFND